MLIDHVRTRRGRGALTFLLSVSLLLSSGVAFAQTPEEKAAARALATQGQEALATNRYAEALDLVTRAEAIVHAPTHLLLIGRAQVGLGKLVAAQETFLKLTREQLKPGAPPAFKAAKDAAKDELAAVEPKIASLKIALDGVGQKKVTVKMDEQIVPPALVGVYRPVDPGKHAIGVYPLGQSPITGSVELKPGEKKDIRLLIPEGPPASGVPLNPQDNPDAGKLIAPPKDIKPAPAGFMTPVRGAGIGVGAVGVAGVVVGSIFLAKGMSSSSQADELCGTGQCPPAKKAQIEQLDKDASTQKTVGVVGLVAGGVMLAGGVTMLIVGKPKAAAPAKAFVEPWFAGNSLGLRGAF